MKRIKQSAQKIMTLMVVLGCASPAIVAQTTQNQTNNQSNQQARMADTSFVRKNIMDSRMEIELSQLALQRSTNPAITTLAQQMVKDHSQFVSELQTYASSKNIRIEENRNRPGTGMDADSTRMQSRDRFDNNSTVNNSSNNNTTNNSSNAGNTGAKKSGIGIDTTSGAINPRDTGRYSTTNPNQNRMNNSTVDTISRRNNATGNNTTGTTNRGTNSNASANSNKTDTSRAGTTSNTGSVTNQTNSAGNVGVRNNNADRSMNPKGNQQHGMQHDVQGLQGLSGRDFDDKWVSHMLMMHESKVSELTQANQWLQDAQLKASASKALPLIQSHRNALARLKSSTGNTNDRNSNNNNNPNKN
ncbi:MAG: DUF4142 domain-containing protein [Chitinophagaceae bacterium]|nr:DUF4142 domain-containing protein [Chitinophagaceae bacterium]